MALAVLNILSHGPGAIEAEADIGSNRYFSLLVGHKVDGGQSSRWGDEEMADLRVPAEIQPAPPGNNPLSRRFRVTVPSGAFNRDYPDLQLVSYGDQQGNNPARSRVYRVGRMLSLRESDMGDYAHGLPPQMASQQAISERMDGQPLSLSTVPVRSMRMAFQEVAISRAQFLDSILQALVAVAPEILRNLPRGISGVLPGLPQRQPESAGPPAAPSQAARSEDGAISNQVLVSLLRQVVATLASRETERDRGGGVAPELPTASEAQFAQSASLLRYNRHPLISRRMPGGYGEQLARRIPYARPMDGGVLSGPLLSGLLGSLAGPLLEQAPQLLGVLVDKPLDFLSTIIRAQAENDLQQQQNQQALIRDLLSETNRSLLLEQLLERVGQGGGNDAAALMPLLVGTQSYHGSPRPQEAETVMLRFEPGTLIDVGGKMKSVFDPQSDGITLRMVLTLRNGKEPLAPIPRAIAELTFTDLETGKTLATKNYKLRDIWPGKPILMPVDPDMLADLPRQRDLQTRAMIRWPVANGKIYASRAWHAICLVDGLVFAGPGRSYDEIMDVSHPGDYRAFWNKLWEGTAGQDQSRWEMDVLCRYYLRVTGRETTNARLETRISPAPVNDGKTRRIAGKMRGGMELSIDMLNAVLATHSTGLPPAELAALKQADLRSDFDQEATSRLRLRGKGGQLGVVWAFPGFKLRDLLFLEPVARDSFGQLTEIRRKTLRFPLPDRVHFLPMRTKR